MADLTPELAAQVVAACTENAEEAAGALGRALDGDFVLKAGEPTPFASVSAEALAGGGLVFAFKFGAEQMLAVLPASGGLIPDWTKAPDPTGQSKLNTLGQELSMLLVPDTLMADSFDGKWVDDLAAAAGRSEPATDATAAPIELARGEALTQMTLVWPVANADAAFGDAAAPEAAPAEAPAPAAPALEAAAPVDEPPAEELGPRSRVLRWNGPPPRDLRDLPPNALSALRVTVPVSVNLAGKKIPLSEVVELGPGSIITFDKACDAPLELTVGNRPVASGEAVKVGERFGIRVQKMILPDEHFRPMLPPRARA
ncbi:Flagellar motor switch protein FliN [Botrimarina colliarenosi]|uniref:Flagellar motor switch protein FliN n=1 Tax=Botrimarina colliarenosi TaxID=2528001 RepID=A0A5C6AM22_9BACT|nr:FliM/FliN family flagellar motor C-terminal domain-containing protein [Botrimarina colliarenosi]TWT99233.1 Flagellar motor switch protein FliN [Botrimarina colliarenosi]